MRDIIKILPLKRLFIPAINSRFSEIEISESTRTLMIEVNALIDDLNTEEGTGRFNKAINQMVERISTATDQEREAIVYSVKLVLTATLSSIRSGHRVSVDSLI